VQPEIVNVDQLLLLELESPFATVLVLRIFPLRADASLEEMIVGLESEFGRRRNIVLRWRALVHGGREQEVKE
jgi:hypothetical protein